MSLKFAILGLLNALPMTGYDLKHQAFDQTVQHFWPADQSQIYRTLGRLEENGWVVKSVEPQDDRPDRHVYAITAEGQRALMEWLTSDQRLVDLRDPLLVQIFFGQEVPREDLLRVLNHQQRAHRERLASYKEIPIPPADSRPQDRWLALQHLTLEFGMALEQMYIDWLKRCRSVVAGLPDADEVEDFRRRFDPNGQNNPP